MGVLIDIGSNKNNPADDTLTITVRPGDTVTVTNHPNSADTISYRTKGHSGGDSGPLGSGASTSLTAAGTHYLTSNSRSTIKVTGGIYGS